MHDIKGILKKGEYHPACDSAINYIKTIVSNPYSFQTIVGILKDDIENRNRNSEICLATLHDFNRKLPVDQCYILGLAWTIREIYLLLDVKEEKIDERSKHRKDLQDTW